MDASANRSNSARDEAAAASRCAASAAAVCCVAAASRTAPRHCPHHPEPPGDTLRSHR